MRNKFSELIEAGVAAFHHEARDGASSSGDCLICRLYNNIWAIPSDTHMSITSDGRRIISGHMIEDTARWDRFTNATNWGGIDFTTSGYACLGELMYVNGFRMTRSFINGDKCIEIVKNQESDMSCCPACTCACTSYVTSESRIPRPINDIVKDRVRFNECLANVRSLDEIVERLNREYSSYGIRWYVNEGRVMTAMGNVSIALIIDEGELPAGVVHDEELDKLMKDIGLEGTTVAKIGNHFEVVSSDPAMQKALRSVRQYNKIYVKDYKELTPGEWSEQILNIIHVIS